MFRLFKINDPYRLVAIFILAFAIKLPFILGGCAYGDMNHWLLIGEAVHTTSMYKGIFDPLGPLSTTVYAIIFWLFGKSILALQILGTILMVIQAIIFNNLTIRNKVYEQNTYLPAFAYLIISSTHYSLTVFSPIQLGMTFILLAFSELLSHVEFRAKRDEQIMSIGLMVGLASLFYLPLIIFLPIIILILLIFTNTLSRRYVVLAMSGIMPLLTAFAYFWIMHGSIGYFITNFIIPGLTINYKSYLSIWHNYPLLIPLLFFWLLGFVTMPKQRRLNNYQNRLAQLFFVTGLLTLVILAFDETDISIAMAVFLPVGAYFATHLFFIIKRPLADLVISFIFVGATLFISYETEFNFVGWPAKAFSGKEINPDLLALVKDKKIWVIGEKPELYEQARIGTTFYDWSLSLPVLENLDYYDNLVFINSSVELFKPELIIDYDFTFSKIQSHIPQLREEYSQIRPFVWVRN